MLDWLLPLLFAIVLGLGSAIGALENYFHVYFEEPPKRPVWPKFLAAEKELQFDFRLWYIEQKTRFRLWWAS